MSDKWLSLDKARWGLAKLWFIGVGAIALLVIVQSFGTVYGNDVSRVFNWMLPHLMPTISLIGSVLGANALLDQTLRTEQRVRRSYFRLTIVLSICYLVLMLISLLFAPFVAKLHGARIIETIESYNIWLAPIQSVVIACIATLFFTKERRNSGLKKSPPRG